MTEVTKRRRAAPRSAETAGGFVPDPPQRVEILDGKSLRLEAGRAVNLTCQVTGSRPTPVIAWFKDDEPLLDGTLVSEPGETTH